MIFDTNKIKNNVMKILLKIFSISIILLSTGIAQTGSQNKFGVYVDSNGVMRWAENNEEVCLFGINYTVPFAYSYRALKRLNLDLKKAIDIDVAQFKRLDLDAFRVHMWDREISDSIGNVIQNEHLDLFDYLLAKLSENGIKTVITPIAWWADAWPEPDFKTPGFSDRYSKVEMITDPKAREAQKNYLKQIINHVNPYTKFSYKDDPSIIAVEIINEPHHPADTALVTAYINEMYDVLRDAGLTKPIFYNISENWSKEQAQAVVRSKVQGVSFQWYPTGLVHNKKLEGDYLINVNKYAIPSEGIKGFDKKAKMVYEFDAADIGDSYVYPAMARSYREAGMQFATMFSYDPSQIAWSNTEYSTHFLNLLYTPGKAIGLMIAAKAFHKLPRMNSYGTYPQNNSFENLKVSYEENLSEFNSDTEFLYSNNTSTVSVSGASLKQIAGTGSSTVVKYDGTGAYFLDKIEDGIWRLEVYPDVLWLADPFAHASMSRQAARLFWNEREMNINLPDLGNDFSVSSISGNTKTVVSVRTAFKIKPGAYIVASKEVGRDKLKKYLINRVKFLDGLYTPPKKSPGIYVVNKTEPYMCESENGGFSFKIASDGEISKAYLFMRRLGWRGFEKHELKNTGGFNYSMAETSKILTPGDLEYCVAVEARGKTFTFPGGVETSPDRWDFYSDKFWDVKIIGPGEPFRIFDIKRDMGNFVFTPYSRTMKYVPDYKNGSNGDGTSLSVDISFDGENETPFALQSNISKLTGPMKSQLVNYNYVVVKARATKDSSISIGLNFLLDKGKAYGTTIKLNGEWNDIKIPVKDFKIGKVLILPFSYPHFLPKYWNPVDSRDELDPSRIQSIQITCGNNSVKSDVKSDTGFEIESITLMKD